MFSLSVISQGQWTEEVSSLPCKWTHLLGYLSVTLMRIICKKHCPNMAQLQGRICWKTVSNWGTPPLEGINVVLTVPWLCPLKAGCYKTASLASCLPCGLCMYLCYCDTIYYDVLTWCHTWGHKILDFQASELWPKLITSSSSSSSFF